MDFKDYSADTITLSDDSWEHIQGSHPEITIEAISSTLNSPDEIRKSRRVDYVNLYYQKRVNGRDQVRFVQVVVKNMPDGKFISTAMTTSKIKDGEIIYKR